MSRKKILLILGAVVLITTIVFLAVRNGNPSKKNSSRQVENPVVFYFNGAGNGLSYDKTTRQVLRYNEQTQSGSAITSIESPTPQYLELSPSGDSLLYITDPNENDAAVNGNPDAQNLVIKPVKATGPIITKENIFSAHYLDNQKVIYQLLPPDGNGSLNVTNITDGKTVQQIDIGDDFSEDIYVLDSSHVIVNEYSSDVAKTSARLVDLTSAKVSDYLSGNGLKFKTVPGSQYLAYQIIGTNGVATTNLINWQTKNSVLAITAPLDVLIWTKDGKAAYFVKDNQVIKHDLVTGVETVVADITPPVLAFEIAGEKSLFLQTTNTIKTIGTN